MIAYTGAFTVYAAAGGARSTTSVDLSATYLDWAAANLALNDLADPRHELVRGDVLAWLEAPRPERYDLIVLDPPSFSNSKRMRGVLDLQRVPYMSGFLKNVYAFVNLAMAGFVMATVCVRFVFPAVSSEGGSFWIIRTAPITLGDDVYVATASTVRRDVPAGALASTDAHSFVCLRADCRARKLSPPTA